MIRMWTSRQYITKVGFLSDVILWIVDGHHVARTFWSTLMNACLLFNLYMIEVVSAIDGRRGLYAQFSF
jgi:hypothetical protein